MRLPIVTLSFALLTAVLTVLLTEDLGAFQATEQWTVDPEPDVVIESDAEGNELFQVRGITVFADGSAAIMHASLANLLFTDGDGRLVASFGREGEGPGEFRTPELVGLARGDSVSVWDSRLARFHQVARDGGFRTYRPLQWSGRRAPVAVEGDRALTASTQTGAEPGRQRAPQTWMFRFAESGDGPVLAELELSVLFTIQGDGFPPATLVIPLAARPVGTLSGGRAYLANGADKVIRVFDGGGNEVDSLVLPWLPVPPVTDEMFLAALRQQTRSEPSPELVNLLPVDDRLPAIAALKADSEGRIWIQSFPVPGAPSVQWWVIRPDGSLVAEVSIPAGLQVHAVSSEYLWGVTLDEYDVESVVRFPVSR